MAIVKYTDAKGNAKVVEVPNDATPDMYKWGVVLGPPDLTPLGLPKEQLQQLYKLLVDNNLYNAPKLIGKRLLIRQILQQVGIPVEKLNTIIGIYQELYYGRDG